MLRPFQNKGWAYHEKMQSIAPSSGARGTHAFRPASAPVVAPTVLDFELHISESPATSPTTPAVGNPVLHQPAAATSTQAHTTPLACPPANAITSTASVSSSNKRAFADMALPDDDILSYMASDSSPNPQLSLSSPYASTTLVSMPPASKKSRRAANAAIMQQATDSAKHSGGRGASNSKMSNAAAVWAMQGSVNRIGDILETVIVATVPGVTTTGTSSSTDQTGTATASQVVNLPTPLTSEIRTLTSLERAMHIMHTEDADLPADDLGILMVIFGDDAEGRTTEIYSRSPHPEARRAFVKTLITAYNRRNRDPQALV
jgi:hypothetical protein